MGANAISMLPTKIPRDYLLEGACIVKDPVEPTAEASRPASDLYAALRALVPLDSTAPRQTVCDAASAIIVEAVAR